VARAPRQCEQLFVHRERVFEVTNSCFDHSFLSLPPAQKSFTISVKNHQAGEINRND
jgi:hypothetical protein